MLALSRRPPPPRAPAPLGAPIGGRRRRAPGLAEAATVAPPLPAGGVTAFRAGRAGGGDCGPRAGRPRGGAGPCGAGRGRTSPLPRGGRLLGDSPAASRGGGRGRAHTGGSTVPGRPCRRRRSSAGTDRQGRRGPTPGRGEAAAVPPLGPDCSDGGHRHVGRRWLLGAVTILGAPGPPGRVSDSRPCSPFTRGFPLLQPGRDCADEGKMPWGHRTCWKESGPLSDPVEHGCHPPD
ncbi:collagen alpha-1(I) chain-like [Zalophus californianus]|uniref:Collagen alpha-1(I) chain-like n=1 Tax=Zalophus californianus TaxID=9704 RepID=A0A6J2CM41_ZALCA|nr:collagen alpha-1(I) chain-like [Zalophus californianus]